MPEDSATARASHRQVNQLPVPSLEAETNYETFKNEVEMWQVVTDIPKQKQGIWLALAISPKHPLNLKDKVLGSGVGKEKLGSEDGVKNLLDCLDKKIFKDSLVDLYDWFKKIEQIKRNKDVKMEQYILDFNDMIAKAEKKGLNYPDSIKAFKLLEGSRTTEIEKQLVMGGIKVNKDSTDLFEQMEVSLKKFAGEIRSLG